MSGFTSFGGSAAATNPDITYESVGWNTGTATGVGILSGVANTAGNWISVGTTVAAFSGFILRVLTSDQANGRLLFDISLDGGSTTYIPNVYAHVGSVANTRPASNIRLPMQVPAGSTISLRCRSSVASTTPIVDIIGILASSTGVGPGFTTATAIEAADTTNTRPGTVAINLSTGATTWTDLEASTAAQYGAVLMQCGAVSAVSAAQIVRATLATGASTFEVPIGWADFYESTTGPPIPNAQFLIEKTIPISTPLSVSLQAAAAGAPDTVTVGLIGFS